ncbi:MAG: hypothetical protein K1X72_03390 [Pyrinomonadaceae bacterium]|nr:hypothetical protein [Pyrinomonadaceae bacterium]
MTNDVILPINQKVIFPSICVVCEKPNPDGEIELNILGANTQSLAVEVTDLALMGRTYGTNTNNEIKGIPACKSCSNGLKWYHRILKIATYTAWIPGLILAIIMPGPTFLKVIVMLGFVIAPPILSIIFPPSFGATFYNGKATFEFKSANIAEQFKKLNEAN